MKRSILSLIVAGVLSTSAVADDKTSGNNWEKGAKDAWIDGKAEATLLFNGNLDSFDINTDVRNGEIVLTGSVENSVDKKLAEELVANIEGVTSVDNQLSVTDKRDRADELADAADEMEEEADEVANNVEEESEEVANNVEEESEEEISALTDAKIATVVKTRLLMDSDISGFDIDVDVENGIVTLTGEVDTDAERDLAVQIAKNASDVVNVEADLKVVNETAMSTTK
ncbi:BON domain-containing protein [Alteromonas sp. ASW11-19]|uniref:BON domain-containing protein n=1 Tax=Alteromonas salexigens TaxID=2982530 RepID=A0ABT2VRD4_9ALTE|nr:BON domain-containing protein [Alteromonas salexigens]MCU7555867.1 BON domain-containing protein [Alteromonas salexigens]